MTETGGLLLGIDEGTTAVKAALFDRDLRLVAEARRPVASRHPGLGRVEQDPVEIERAVIESVGEVLAARAGRTILAVGLDHQGESVLAWDVDTGAAITPVVVWQDKRSEPILRQLDGDVVERSGLPLDPYFSAGKLAWLLAHDPAVAAARARGALRLGTVDAFLSQRFGGDSATDLSTASRTQLLALGGGDWDGELCATFGVPVDALPTLRPSFGALGTLRHPDWPIELPLCARVVDQQAALAGAGCLAPGEVKATYGTGVFVLGLRDGPLPYSDSGLLSTVAWSDGDSTQYALDGGVFAAGALLDWLASDLGLAADAAALAGLAATVPDSSGVRVLPALAGLGAPWWRPEARGVIAGLHGGARPAHIARAALEAIAWRVTDIVEAMSALTPLRELRVDGGLTNDPTLVQLQADALGAPVLRTTADVTVLGAALLAGVGAGVFASLGDAATRLPAAHTVLPDPTAMRQRQRAHERWRAFVATASML